MPVAESFALKYDLKPIYDTASLEVVKVDAESIETFKVPTKHSVHLRELKPKQLLLKKLYPEKPQ